MRVHRLALTALSLAATACATPEAPARDQWVIEVSTDATLPQFGDRLLVDVLASDGSVCSTCSRLFDASESTKLPLSFGLRRTSDERRIRVRLLRQSTIGEDEAVASASRIDTLVALPDPDGVEAVSIALSTRCFGIPASIADETSCDPRTGTLAAIATAGESTPLATGTWDRDDRRPCAGEAPTKMVCVNGGGFLLGDVSAFAGGVAETEARPEHVVVLSPFFIDANEMTVGDFRALQRSHPELPNPPDPAKAGTPADCTFLTSSTKNDTLPLTCVQHGEAANICIARGGRLPTEAEWEYAAGNGAAETRYPWGSDPDVCAHATVSNASLEGSNVCESAANGTLPPWPIASTGTDINSLGIVDMGGSVSEWVADGFSSYGTGCWAKTGVIHDPHCNALDAYAARGGSWHEPPNSAEVTRRGRLEANGASAQLGLRCVVPAD